MLAHLLSQCRYHESTLPLVLCLRTNAQSLIFIITNPYSGVKGTTPSLSFQQCLSTSLIASSHILSIELYSCSCSVVGGDVMPS